MFSLNQEKVTFYPLDSSSFPSSKRPIQDADYVRNAVVRFSQVRGVIDDERNEARQCVVASDKNFSVGRRVSSWRELTSG